jgi:hypothetical protein
MIIPSGNKVQLLNGHSFTVNQRFNIILQTTKQTLQQNTGRSDNKYIRENKEYIERKNRI